MIIIIKNINPSDKDELNEMFNVKKIDVKWIDSNTIKTNRAELVSRILTIKGTDHVFVDEKNRFENRLIENHVDKIYELTSEIENHMINSPDDYPTTEANVLKALKQFMYEYEELKKH